MYFTIIVGVFIALGAVVDPAAALDPDFNPVAILLLTILVVSVAPVPGVVLSARVKPEQLLDPFTRTRVLRRVRIGSLLYQVYLLGSFALIIYVLDWPLFISGALRIDNWVLVDELLRLAPFLCMLVLAWMPLYRIDRMLRRGTWSMRQYIEFHFRQYVLFILMPFMVMVAMVDVLELLPWAETLQEAGLDWLIPIAVMPALYVFAPLMLRYVWKTRRMEEGPLRRRLHDLCGRAHVGYRDILVWETIGGHVVNACVTGIIAPARFIMVTDALMGTLSGDEIEGVFAHEIGHVKRHHMTYYLLFALAFIAVFVVLTSAPSFETESGEALAELLSLQSLGLLALVVVYWGLAFGFISRRMEIEADLYAVELTGNTATFVNALEQISFFSGRPRTAGSWRHFSIAKRTEFLRTCESDPSRRGRFKRRMAILRLGIVVFALLAGVVAAVTIFS